MIIESNEVPKSFTQRPLSKQVPDRLVINAVGFSDISEGPSPEPLADLAGRGPSYRTV